ncbi:MAG: drug/metabolite transporter (DMT)-like permease [Gammaproteobacteria bacterium]|jgi:drug/metabolite transporter (DMT)-like permease
MTDSPSTLPKRSAYLMLVVVMLLWSSGIIVARGVHESVVPIAFSFWRWLVAALILSPFAWPRIKTHAAFLRTQLLHIALLGLFIAGGSTMIIVAVRYTTATNVALVSATQPLITALVAWFVLRERLSARQFVGIAAATIGIVAMITRLDIDIFRTLSFNLGDSGMLLSVSFYALYAVNLHRWIGQVGPVLVMFLTAAGGAVILLPFYLAEVTMFEQMAVSWKVAGAVLYMAIVPTLIATTMWNISVGVVGPNRATAFTNLLPVFGTALAVTLLGEYLEAYHIIGGLFVCVGISLVIRPEPDN